MKKPGWILVLAQFALLIALVLVPDQPHPSEVVYLAGRSLAILALVLLLIAAFVLRPSITALPEPRSDAPFITSGIYRYLRHPMYASLILFAFSVSVYKWSLLAVLAGLALFIVLNIKYRYEDSLLRQKWPAAAAYQKQVGALFPKSIRPTYKSQ
jgi:protein-S-isoprenylcysteine O-methyltransferase Ste14